MTLNLFNLNSLNLDCDGCLCNPCGSTNENIVKVDNNISIKKLELEDVEGFILQLEKTTSILINKEYIIIESSDIPFLGLNTEDIRKKKLCEVLPAELYLFYNDIIIVTLLEKYENKLQILINETMYELIFIPIKCSNEIYGLYIIQIPYSRIKRVKSENNNQVIKYYINSNYNIVDLTHKTWDEFVKKNLDKGNEEFLGYNVINSNLFTHICSKRVKKIYKNIFDKMFTKENNTSVSFYWYCDTPIKTLKMEMKIRKSDTVLEISSNIVEVILNFVKIKYLEYKSNNDGLLVCSFCQRIRVEVEDKNLLKNEDHIEPSHSSVEIIGYNAKKGYTNDEHDILFSWLNNAQYLKYIETEKNKNITHDICSVCENEIIIFTNSIDNL
jgi:hypothetical protein